MTSRRPSVPPVEQIDQPDPDPTDLPSPEDPDDPPPGTPPAPSRSPLSVLFGTPTPPRALPPSSPSPDEFETSGHDDGPGSAAPWIADEPQPVRKATDAKGKKAKLRPILRKAVATLGAQLHTFGTAPDSPERAVGLWLADDDDQKGIGDPVSSILSRRVPSGVDNPDVTDAIDLALGVLGYLMKNLQLRAAVRPPTYDVVPGEASETPDDEDQAAS